MDNRYKAPKAQFTSPAAGRGTYLARMLEVQGRIGRIRYLVYIGVVPVLLMIPLFLMLMIFPKMSTTALGPLLLLPIGATVKIALRRLHDLDKSGWWAILLFVPVVSMFMALYLLFGRGSDGTNRFGAAPEPNSKNLLMAAYALMAIYALSCVLLIPAYNKFSEKMAEAEAQQYSAVAPSQNSAD